MKEQEIRISDDYCHSDIIILDLVNYTMAHAANFRTAHVKKHGWCVLVSVVII